jgi:hypothetical protein
LTFSELNGVISQDVIIVSIQDWKTIRLNGYDEVNVPEDVSS